MKKVLNVIFAMLIMVMVLSACSNPVDEDNYVGDGNTVDTAGDAVDDGVTESIEEADTIDDDLDQDKVDSELDNLEQDLLDW